MNWGYKIMIGFFSFVVAISCMVYIAMKQTNEMIDDNYYEKEMLYQGKIDAANNLASLGGKVIVNDSAGFITITFPLQSVNGNTQGKIEFLRSSEQKKDVVTRLAVNAEGMQLIPKQKFVQGIYQLRIEWTNNGKAYFHEQQLNIIN